MGVLDLKRCRMVELCVDIETEGLNFFETKNPDTEKLEPEHKILALGYKNDDIHGSFLGSEKIVLQNFLNLFDSLNNGCTPKIIGYNVKNFDVPFIFYRCVKHGLDLQSFGHVIKAYDNYKNPFIVDLYLLLNFRIFRNNFTLAAVLKSFGLEGKYNNFSGKDAKNLSQADLRLYVEQDVKIEWDLYQKLKGVGFL